MDDIEGTKCDDKYSNIIYKHRGEEVVESLDPQSSAMTEHINGK